MSRLRFDCRFSRANGFVLEQTFQTDARVLGIRGASGSGKTTIAHLLAGILKPQRGEIVFEENVWTDTNKRVHLPPEQRDLGMVFQDGRLFPHMTVKQNLVFGKRTGHEPIEFMDLVEHFGLKELLQHKPHQLSGGEQQRVALGRALLRMPKLLILDEPFNGIDLERKTKVIDYLASCLDRYSLRMVLITHDPNDLNRLADSIWDIAVA